MVKQPPASNGPDCTKAITPWAAFKAGLQRSLQHWPLWLLFYVATTLVAGLLLLPLEQALIDWLGYRLAVNELAEGLDARLLTDALRQLLDRSAAGQGSPVGLVLLALPVWPLFLSLPFTVLSAGVLEIYAQGRPPTIWRHFWRGLRRYAPSFLLLLFLEVVLLEGSLVLTAVLIPLVGSMAGWIGFLVGLAAGLALLVGLFLLIQWWLAFARISGVTQNTRNVLKMLGGGGSFLRRNIGPAAVLSLILFPLSLAPTLLYRLLNWPLPDSWWGVQILLQQLLILGRLGLRLVRLAAEVCLVQGRGEKHLAK